MKITKDYLKRIIKEELNRVVDESKMKEPVRNDTVYVVYYEDPRKKMPRQEEVSVRDEAGVDFTKMTKDEILSYLNNPKNARYLFYPNDPQKKFVAGEKFFDAIVNYTGYGTEEQPGVRSPYGKPYTTD